MPSSTRCRWVGAGSGRGHHRGVVHRRELPGRAVRRVRPQVGEVGEPRLPLVGEPIEEAVGQERRCRQRRGPLVLAVQRGDGIGEVVALIVEPAATTAAANRSCPAQRRSRAALPRTSKAVDRRVRRRIRGSTPWSVYPNNAGTYPARRAQRGRCCRSVRRVVCRWQRLGCSSGRCPCTAPPAPVNRVRPASSGGPSRTPWAASSSSAGVRTTG